jgi:hypothetical protein
MLSITNLFFYNCNNPCIDWTLNATFNGHCIITFASRNLLVQFASIKMTKILGWSCFIQSKNSLLYVQTSNLTTKSFFVILARPTIQPMTMTVEMATTFFAQIFLWFPKLTSDSHSRWDPIHHWCTWFYIHYLVAMFCLLYPQIWLKGKGTTHPQLMKQQ